MVARTNRPLIAERMHTETNAEAFIRLGIKYALRPLPTVAELREYTACSRAQAYRYLNALRAARGEMSTQEARETRSALDVAYRRELAPEARKRGLAKKRFAERIGRAIRAEKALAAKART